jgi:hypothetical protein
MPNSQIEIDKTILDFLGDTKISTPEDLIVLRDKIFSHLEFRPYNEETKAHANSIQWKRTASEIIKDGYVYEGKACSDLTIVFLALCKAAGIEGLLVKLKSLDDKKTHSIAEVNLNGTWYRMNVSNKDSLPFAGQLTEESIWNKNYKVWKKGRDVWDLELDDINTENKIFKKDA